MTGGAALFFLPYAIAQYPARNVARSSGVSCRVTLRLPIASNARALSHAVQASQIRIVPTVSPFTSCLPSELNATLVTGRGSRHVRKSRPLTASHTVAAATADRARRVQRPLAASSAARERPSRSRTGGSGGLLTGSATDLNTGPLLILLAASLYRVAPAEAIDERSVSLGELQAT
jgi:hypothetical protein